MEEWRAIPGMQGFYEVSSAGRVRSVPRPTKHHTGKIIVRGGRLLAGCVTRGYVKVSLCVDGRVTGHLVHTLVAAAFLGPRPDKHVARHLDGDRSNNAVSNLAYGVQLENSEDMRRHGTLLAGEKHPCAKLTATQVSEMRALRGQLTQLQLAARFGVSKNQVSNIMACRQWRDA